jgi:hypothetical protein
MNPTIKKENYNLPYLGHLFPGYFWVHRRFCQQDWMFLRCYMEFTVKGVVPDAYQVVPVGHNSVLNGIFQGK